MIFDREKHINQPIPIERELNILFDSTKPITIFDIGSCEGEDSIRYSRLFQSAKVYAFEPLPKNVNMIKENISKFNAKNVSVYNIALSSNIGTADFYVSNGKPKNVQESDWDFGNKSSSLLPPDKHIETASFVEFNEKVTIETTTLEAFCKSHNVAEIDFIHMDVQGAELMVLIGAGIFINSIKAIWLEVSKIHLYKDQPLVNDINQFMGNNGFLLVKDCLEDIQGDQLYIAKKYYPEFEQLKIFFRGNLIIRAKSLIRVYLKSGIKKLFKNVMLISA